jgi:hypothetical protein
VTRDDLAPLGMDPLDVDPESFPCPRCGGGGLDPEAGTATLARCLDCSGSGYGPPPPSLDRERAHCLCRLARWAHRECVEETTE